MGDLRLFEFSEEVIGRIRASSTIPIDFYSKEGQVLIPAKEKATAEEIERLLRFVERGIYFKISDGSKLAPAKKKIPDGLTDTPLLSHEVTHELLEDVDSIYSGLKEKALNSFQTMNTKNRVVKMFSDFEKQEDLMSGLINVIQILEGSDKNYEAEIAIKRTAVAMALKSRGIIAQTSSDRMLEEKKLTSLMMSAVLSHIGKQKMKIPTHGGLTLEELRAIRKYPFISYLMVAHDSSLPDEVKYNILCHMRPQAEDTNSANYPTLQWLLKNLLILRQKYSIPGKEHIFRDIQKRIVELKNVNGYQEDVNILSISSEFASLTTKVPWREALQPVEAVKNIINNAICRYTPRIVREFLDYVSISLCDNEMILRPGDYVITGVGVEQGQESYEVAKILEVGRLQSRPLVERFATIQLNRKECETHTEASFDPRTLKPGVRYAKYDLSKDYSRRIVFVPTIKTPRLYEKLMQVAPG